MAITKKFVIHQRLDDRVGYVLNDEKTSLDDMLEYATNDDKTVTLKKEYKSALNCNLETAYQDMMATKKRKNAMGGRLGYHIIQSFKPGEVTAEQAHEIAIGLAQRSFGDYEVVIGTHIDKEHIHSHIVVNSVSVITGKKYRDTTKDLFDGIRETSDQLCREHGLPVVVQKEEKISLTYIEWLARQEKRISWQSLIRMDIDDCIQQSYDFGNFLVLMRLKGYEIKQGKYIAFLPMGKDRFSRGYKLGHNYTQENIQRRIAGLRATTEFKDMQTYVDSKYDFKPFSKVKMGSFRALCLHYMFLLGQVKKNKAPDSVSNMVKEDLIRFEAMIKTINFTKLRNLDTIESVERYKDKCYETIGLIKRDQVQLKKDAAEFSKLFNAVVERSKYARAYELYCGEGFTAMKTEHDKYVAAVRKLKEAGYETDSQIQTLIDRQSEVESKLAQFTSDIRHFRHEIKMCDHSLQLNKRVQEKREVIDKLEQNERNSTGEHQR
jgi:hypothetical protein